MEQAELLDFEISPDSDTSGIRPEDITGGIAFVIGTDANGRCVTQEKRTAKDGGKFIQYTIYGTVDGEKKRISYLFDRDLAPLARGWGKQPQLWLGKTAFVTGIKDRKGYWSMHFQTR